MIRKVIRIDEGKCNGCGLCVSACHEGAIGMVDGKARVMRDDYCDGLGDCLPTCPTGAITFEEREALCYDSEAVKANMERKEFEKNELAKKEAEERGTEKGGAEKKVVGSNCVIAATHLNQWPVQIKLVPVNAPYFKNADLLIAADCTAYAYGNFHAEFMKGKITLIGCPKLDGIDYTDKLTAILRENDINSLTVARMEVPCCGGIANAAKNALADCGKLITSQIVTISTDGNILRN